MISSRRRISLRSFVVDVFSGNRANKSDGFIQNSDKRIAYILSTLNREWEETSDTAINNPSFHA